MDNAEQVLFRVAGANGQIEVLEHRIRIIRKGLLSLMTQGMKGDKDILISSISSVQFKKANEFTRGYIQFGFLGGTENKSGLLAATSDENTVMFNKKDEASFYKVKTMVEQKVIEYRQPVPAQVVQPASSDADEIEKLASLLGRDLITRAEFDEKKRKILGL